MNSLIPFLLLFLHPSYADIVWPEYTQQCADDAGTPFGDDESFYGANGFYHDKTASFPVLQNGECPAPLAQACKDRPTKKAAFLEGPIDCGNNGWYCRIMPDENWPPINLTSDLNFGHCNTTDGFGDSGYDGDGHCHGSSVDNTYYWWVRDHFFRQYNGRLRCCCGWYEGTSETPVYGRRIANACDYRRLVTKTENVNECRDANEEHGLGFYDIGCDPQYRDAQLNKPIPENDDMCWEVQRFGYTEEEYETPTPSPSTPSPPTTNAPTNDGTPTTDAPTNGTPTTDAPANGTPTTDAPANGTPTTDAPTNGAPTTDAPTNGAPTTDAPTTISTELCNDSTVRFRVKINNKNRLRDCKWVAKKSTNYRCDLGDGTAKTVCHKTCDTCGTCIDSETRFKVRKDGKKIERDCEWVGNRKNARCKLGGAADACRETCGLCGEEEEEGRKTIFE